MTERADHHLGQDLGAMAEGGGELDPRRREELLRHLETCSACKAAVESARIVFQAVGPTVLPEPSPGFDRALFARLDVLDREARRASARPSLADRLRGFFTLPRVGAALAAGALAVLLSIVAGRRSEDRDRALGPALEELAQNVEGLNVAEDLDLYRDLEVIEDLDVLDDLELIRGMDDGEAG